MRKLFFRATEETPEIVFDKKNGEFRITGKSYMEDATSHYTQVIDWLKAYSEDPNETTVFKFELEYVNTASSKIVHDVLDVLDNLFLNGADVIVEWHYYEEDEDMEELGREYGEIYEVPFEYQEIKFGKSGNLFED